MAAIVKNIRSMWSVCGIAADRYMDAVKRELSVFEEGWAAAEEYWKDHPEDLYAYFQI